MVLCGISVPLSIVLGWEEMESWGLMDSLKHVIQHTEAPADLAWDFLESRCHVSQIFLSALWHPSFPNFVKSKSVVM